MKHGVSNDTITDQINSLFSTILAEQKKVSKVTPASPENAHVTESILKEFTAMRGKGFFYNYLSSGRGHGPFTELIDGSVKYDMIGAIGVNLLGHSHPLYIKGHLEAATNDVVMCGNLLPHVEALDLTKELMDSVKDSKLKHFWFAGSGSFSNDTALKLVWQKSNPKYRVIAFDNAFAGRTVATQILTSSAEYRDGMPTSIDVDRVPHFDQKNPEKAIETTINALEEIVKKYPDSHCALMIELIQGEAGFVFGPKEYYEAVFKWAKDHGLFVWIDEIQTFGRTTELFAFQMLGLQEYVDIVTIGKALQCCGIMFSPELNPKPGLIAGTFNGSLVSLNVGAKVLKYLKEGNFYGEHGRIKQIEKNFINRLKHLAKNSCRDKITYMGGVGTMISFEVGNSSKDVTTKYLKELFNNGVIAFTSGHDPAVRVRFLIPTSITDEQIEEVLKIVEATAIKIL